MDTNASINWFYDRLGKVTYSMINRNGPSSFDCSSSEYHALIAGGFFPSTIRIGNTDSLYGDLERHGWVKLAPNAQGNYDTQRGDVFIWGARGESGGSAGHTGEFVDPDNIVACSSGYNGIHVDNYDWLHAINGNPEQTFYRYVGQEAQANNPTDQLVEVGSTIRFDGTYRVDEIQEDGNLWQVRTEALCSAGFSWDDNGVPAAAVTEVNADGYATADQELAVGSLYKIPGKFVVNDIGLTNGEWLAQIGSGGLSFWVDVATATEIAPADAGTPVPSQNQQNTAPVVVPPQTPVEPPVVEPPVVVPDPTIPPVVSQEPLPEPVVDAPVENPVKVFLKSLLDALVKLILHVVGKG